MFIRNYQCFLLIYIKIGVILDKDKTIIVLKIIEERSNSLDVSVSQFILCTQYYNRNLFQIKNKTIIIYKNVN